MVGKAHPTITIAEDTGFQMKNFFLIVFIFIAACAPAATNGTSDPTSIEAEIVNPTAKYFKPNQTWALLFKYQEIERLFTFTLADKLLLNNVRPGPDPDGSVAIIKTSDGLVGLLREEDPYSYASILIFANKQAQLNPRVLYGRLMSYYWSTEVETVYECHFDKPPKDRGDLYTGDSHFGRYQSPYGKELQKNGCRLFTP